MQARLLSDGHCLRVIDGDTILARIVCPCCRITSEQRVRLARIDAPELKGEHRGTALLAKKHLATLCQDQPIKLAVCRTWPDKFGRVIAEVHCNGHNMSDAMLRAEFAVPWGMPPAALWDQD